MVSMVVLVVEAMLVMVMAVEGDGECDVAVMRMVVVQ